jgi:hypothetical protein
MPKRFIVRTLPRSITRVIREPYQVIDTAMNTVVDAYKSKKAAAMHAKHENKKGLR